MTLRAMMARALQVTTVRAIRGATSVPDDTGEAISAAVRELLTTVRHENGLRNEEVISAIFTLTPAIVSIDLAPSTAVICQPGRALAIMIGIVPGPVPKSTSLAVSRPAASSVNRARIDSITSGNFARAYARASSGRSINSGSG